MIFFPSNVISQKIERINLSFLHRIFASARHIRRVELSVPFYYPVSSSLWCRFRDIFLLSQLIIKRSNLIAMSIRQDNNSFLHNGYGVRDNRCDRGNNAVVKKHFKEFI